MERFPSPRLIAPLLDGSMHADAIIKRLVTCRARTDWLKRSNEGGGERRGLVQCLAILKGSLTLQWRLQHAEIIQHALARSLHVAARMSVALKPRFSPCCHAPTPAHYPSPNCEPPNRHLQEPQFRGSAPSV